MLPRPRSYTTRRGATPNSEQSYSILEALALPIR